MKSNNLMNKQFIFGLILFGLSSLSTANAATYSIDLTIAGGSADVTSANPLSLSIDYGFGFSDITSVVFSGTFETDLWDVGERVGAQDSLTSATWVIGQNNVFSQGTGSRDAFSFGLGFATPLQDSLKLGLTNFFFTATDVNLTSFIVTVEGTQVSTVPLPAALWLFGPALLGFMGFRRKAVDTAAA